MAAEAGAELTLMENRFVPSRFKDGYGPVGAWFLLFKAQATNASGETYMTRNKELLDDYPPYGQAAVPASCPGNHLMRKEMKEGRGPIWMDTVTALANLRETLSPREVKRLEAEAWEDFLDMCVGQCGMMKQVFFGELTIKDREGAWEKRVEERREIPEYRRQAEIAEHQRKQEEARKAAVESGSEMITSSFKDERYSYSWNIIRYPRLPGSAYS